MKLFWQIVAGVALAAVLVGALQWWVGSRLDPSGATADVAGGQGAGGQGAGGQGAGGRGAGGQGAGGRTAVQAAAGQPPGPGSTAGRPDDPGAAGRRLLQNLEGEAGSFHLASSRADLPPDCAPILAVKAGGRIEVPVAAPLARRPGPLRWPCVGVVLPATSLGGLTAAERASLAAICSELSGASVPAPGRVFLHGCTARSGELEQLLRWAR